MGARRVAAALAAAGMVLGLGLASAPAATAYPPGTNMTLASASPSVAVNTYVTLTASNVKPGCRVTFSAYGSSSRTATANGSGVATVQFRFGRTGSITARATTSSYYGCGGEYATTVVTVFGPPSAPSNLRATSTTTTVTATWKSPCSCGGLPLKWWTVSLYNSRGNLVSGPHTTTSPTYAFSGLTRYTYSYVKVRATNTGNLTGRYAEIRVKTAR